jgi:2,3-bisphosphoglycerate-independent phosphoglycerate mutase
LFNKRGPLALIILDGWGYTAEREANAIALAETPFYDGLLEKYPHTLIEASGTCVGLPDRIMGNSEVGHLNMGSGRRIMTDIRRIDYSVETGEFFSNEALVSVFDAAKRRGGALHFMGLLSDGLVHSSQEHLYALLRMARDRGHERVYVHCFLDGRDTPPSSALHYVKLLQGKIAEIGRGEIATVCGRYYAMDRDKRWERTERAYRMLINGEGERASDPLAAVRASYERGVTDEIVFFNFRADRARQITRALTVPDFGEFPTPGRPQIGFACFTVYDREFGLPVVFPQLQHKNILAEVFAGLGVRNYRLAETEKYAHVTYFFNGGTELEFPSERRLLIPSPKVATYDLMPEMAAFKITDKLLRAIEEGETDVFVVNFANPDMVGHTGVLDKTIEAVQHVDTCLGWITKALKVAGGTCLITADHGNCEQMIDFGTGQPHTAHTSNPVPFHLIGEGLAGITLREGGALEDVAPTILGLLGVEKPAEMSGRDLRETS